MLNILCRLSNFCFYLDSLCAVMMCAPKKNKEEAVCRWQSNILGKQLYNRLCTKVWVRCYVWFHSVQLMHIPKASLDLKFGVKPWSSISCLNSTLNYQSLKMQDVKLVKTSLLCLVAKCKEKWRWVCAVVNSLISVGLWILAAGRGGGVEGGI